MGKRVRGAALRSKKRQYEARKEEQQAKAAEVESHHVVKQSNEQLFVLDTKADETVVVPKEETASSSNKKAKKGLNHVDQKKVEELMEKHSPEELQKMVSQSKTQIQRAKKSRRTVGNVRPSFDLWAEKDEGALTNNKKSSAVVATTKSSVTPGIGLSLAGTKPSGHVQIQHRPASQPKKKTLPVQVAQAGQSYHPDVEQHQDVVGEALAVELRRKEVQEYNDTPISNGMSEKTLSLLLASDDEEDEASDDDDDDDDETQSATPISMLKRKEKLTRAQRNKKKRHRALEKDIDERKRNKKFLSSLQELKKHKKALEHKRREEAEHKTKISQLKEESKRVLGKNVLQRISQVDPLEVPTVPVALTKELRSSLRSVKPKGSLLVDRLESFRDRNMMDKKLVGDKKKIIQGNKRSRIKVRNRSKHRVKTADGGDFLLMG